MLKKSITYKDFADEERTENYYFNMTEEELLMLELGVGDENEDAPSVTLSDRIKEIVEAKDAKRMMIFFRNFILNAYGTLEDGNRFFVKSPEKSHRFSQSAAYTALFNELVTDGEAAASFIKAVLNYTE